MQNEQKNKKKEINSDEKIGANSPLKITAIITAAGKGERSGLEKNKVLYPLFGEKTVLEKCAEVFDRNERITEIIFTASSKDYADIDRIAKKQKTPAFTVTGGETRALSVFAALKKTNGDIVLVHDGARPFVTEKIIDDCIDGVMNFGSAVTCVPCVNSIAELNDDGDIIKCSRARKATVQTPQGFYTRDILKAYSLAFSGGETYPNERKAETFTDESGVYSQFIRPAHAVNGDVNNVKLTYPEDFAKSGLDLRDEKTESGKNEKNDDVPPQKSELADLFGSLKGGFGTNENLRGGVGVDLHRLVEGRKLILGGVEIPHEKGLLGHSDADVLTHAIMDALLSAAALRDIGFYFSDKDDAYKNISSLILLKKVLNLLAEKGYKPNNVSAVIQAQKPKLSPFIDKIRASLASELGIPAEFVGVGCTTLEGIGVVGREEGIAATAFCTIKKIK